MNTYKYDKVGIDGYLLFSYLLLFASSPSFFYSSWCNFIVLSLSLLLLSFLICPLLSISLSSSCSLPLFLHPLPFPFFYLSDLFSMSLFLRGPSSIACVSIAFRTRWPILSSTFLLIFSLSLITFLALSRLIFSFSVHCVFRRFSFLCKFEKIRKI